MNTDDADDSDYQQTAADIDGLANEQIQANADLKCDLCGAAITDEIIGQTMPDTVLCLYCMRRECATMISDKEKGHEHGRLGDHHPVESRPD